LIYSKYGTKINELFFKKHKKKPSPFTERANLGFEI
jgi:hypothetical protein